MPEVSRDHGHLVRKVYFRFSGLLHAFCCDLVDITVIGRNVQRVVRPHDQAAETSRKPEWHAREPVDAQTIGRQADHVDPRARRRITKADPHDSDGQTPFVDSPVATLQESSRTGALRETIVVPQV